MTRADRLIAIMSFVAAVVVLFLLVSALSGNVGPVEFVLVVVLAIPVGMLIGRLVRSALGTPRGTT
jgi:hypothetical protein